MKTDKISPHFPWILVGNHLSFLGKPSCCQGRVHLRNQSSEKLRIKRIPLVDSKLSGPAEVPVSGLQVFARLLPGAEVQACAQIFMPPQTQPGRYSAEALVGESRKDVTVDVLESWDIAVIPSTLSLKLAVGTHLTRTIQVTNLGNMPWEIRGAAFAPLHEQHDIHRDIYLSLKEGGKSGYEKVLNDFAARLHDTLVEPAKIKIKSKTEVLQPGETEDIELEISLPASLKKNRRYNCEVTFENASLLLEIEMRQPSTATRKGSKS